MDFEDEKFISKDASTESAETTEVDSTIDYVSEGVTRPVGGTILTGVVLTQCPVVSYNKHNGILVYERDGRLIQTTDYTYSGDGYVEVE